MSGLQDVIVKTIFLAFWLISCMWDVTVGLSVMSQPEWRTIFPCFLVDVLQDVDIIVVSVMSPGNLNGVGTIFLVFG